MGRGFKSLRRLYDMFKKFALFLATILALVKILAAVSAGGEIFDFLKIIPSAQLQALGGFNASWPQKLDVLLINPAASPQARPARFQFNTGYLVDSLLDTNGLFAISSGKNFFAINLDYLTIYQNKPLRTIADNTQPDGYRILGEINPYFYNLGFGWARRVAEDTSVGTRIKIVGQKLDQKQYCGLAVDAGLFYHPIAGVLRKKAIEQDLWNLGVGITNLGLAVSDYSLPLGAYLGVSRIMSRWVTFGLGGVYYQSGTGELNSGILVDISPAFSLSIGYNSPLKNDNLVEEFYQRFRGGFSLTFGPLGFNYAFVPAGGLGNNHFFGLIWIN